MLGILNVPLSTMSNDELDALTAYYYDKYAWVTDDLEDLHLATIFKWARTHPVDILFANTNQRKATAGRLLKLWAGSLPFKAKEMFG